MKTLLKSLALINIFPNTTVNSSGKRDHPAFTFKKLQISPLISINKRLQ